LTYIDEALDIIEIDASKIKNMDKYLSTYAKMKFIKEMTDEEYKKNDNSYEINFVKQFDDLEEND